MLKVDLVLIKRLPKEKMSQQQNSGDIFVLTNELKSLALDVEIFDKDEDNE